MELPKNTPGTQFLSAKQPTIYSRRAGKWGISFPCKDPFALIFIIAMNTSLIPAFAIQISLRIWAEAKAGIYQPDPWAGISRNPWVCVWFSVYKALSPQPIFSLPPHFLSPPPQTIGWLLARVLGSLGCSCSLHSLQGLLSRESPRDIPSRSRADKKMSLWSPVKLRKREGNFKKSSLTNITLHKAAAFISKAGHEFLP